MDDVCEWNHVASGVACTGEQAFALEAHGRVKRICLPAAQRTFATMRGRCYCHQPKWKHWDITPIEHVEATA